MKKIVFLTGTRADFGKMRLVILTLMRNKKFKVDVFVTGMHLMKKYGYTVEEIKKVGIKRLFKFRNQKLNYNKEVRMDVILSKTIDGFSKYVKKSVFHCWRSFYLRIFNVLKINLTSSYAGGI